MTLKEVLEKVVAESGDGHAIGYAKAALTMGGATGKFETEWEGKKTIRAVSVTPEATGEIMTGEYLKVQLKHILNNLGKWENEEVKAVLKEHSK